MKAGWSRKTLDELCEIARGGSPRPIQQYFTDAEDGINWIKISDATASSKYIYKTKQKIKPEGVKRSRMVHEGDFVLSNSMSFGRPYIMGTSGCIHDGWLVLGSVSEVLDRDYLYHFLSSPEAYRQFDDRASGSTVRNLNIDLVRSVEVPIPPLSVQKHIVAILDEAFAGIDAAIANTEKNLANAHELFESYLASVFSRNVEVWVKTTLGEAYDVRDGTHDSPKYQPVGRALVTSKNLKRDGLNFEKIKYISEEDYISISRRSEVHKGDVLFAMIGTIGNPIVVEVEPDFAIKNVALFKVARDRNGHFLKYYLGSRMVIDKMMAEAKGTTQKFVGLGYLRQFPISIPELDVESEIVKSLTDLENEINRLESIYQQKLTALVELKQSLLQKAFAGELTASAMNEAEEAVA